MDNNVDNVYQQKGVRMWINAAAVAIAVFILLAYMATFILFSFNISFLAGLRSLIATILPFMILIYLRLFTNFLRRRKRIPLFNLYFVFTVWTIFLLEFAQSLYGQTFPIGELLFSITLAAASWRYSSQSVNTFLSCCYGIITGALTYVIFAGFPFVLQ
ncbi:MAG: hypothetical protein F6K31_33505 [Symploca sp. SIO2G7]|nr:hypothetical protein [Symploca sp. SIO2G7]